MSSTACNHRTKLPWAPQPRRRAAWARLERDLDLKKLHALTTHVKLEDVPRIASEIIEGKVRGRVVVDIA